VLKINMKDHPSTRVSVDGDMFKPSGLNQPYAP